MIRFFVGTTLYLFSFVALAVQVGGLYSASIEVLDQSQSARNEALEEAFSIVLQKVSGRENSEDKAGLALKSAEISAYVEQFQYQKMEEPASGYLLVINFQKEALNLLMQQVGVPIWGSERPEVLVWLAVKGDGGRYILKADSNNRADQVKQAAADKGLAITLPLLDLEDQRALSFNDIWGGFSDAIVNASARYDAKQIMFGRIEKVSGNNWSLKWTLVNPMGEFGGDEKQLSLNLVAGKSFTGLAEHLAGIYAPSGQEFKSHLQLMVTGVETLPDFIRLTRYLSSLDKVKSVNWEHVEAGKVTLSLSFTGDVAVLKKVIALNHVLIPVEGSASPALRVEELLVVPNGPLESLETEKMAFYRLD